MPLPLPAGPELMGGSGWDRPVSSLAFCVWPVNWGPVRQLHLEGTILCGVSKPKLLWRFHYLNGIRTNIKNDHHSHSHMAFLTPVYKANQTQQEGRDSDSRLLRIALSD